MHLLCMIALLAIVFIISDAVRKSPEALARNREATRNRMRALRGSSPRVPGAFDQDLYNVIYQRAARTEGKLEKRGVLQQLRARPLPTGSERVFVVPTYQRWRPVREFDRAAQPGLFDAPFIAAKTLRLLHAQGNDGPQLAASTMRPLIFLWGRLLGAGAQGNCLLAGRQNQSAPN